MFKKKINRRKKSKFFSTNSKKTRLRIFNHFIEKQETINEQKNQCQRKKLTNYFVKFWKNRWKKHQTKSFRTLIFAIIIKIKNKNNSIKIKYCKREKCINNANTHREYKINEFSIQTQNFRDQFISMFL